MLQATAGARAVLRTSEANGKGALEFDGIDDTYAIDTAIAITAGTVFLVFKMKASYVNVEMLAADDNTSYFPRLLTTPGISIRGTGGSQNSCTGITAFSTTDYQIHCVTNDGAGTAVHYLNGAVNGSFTGTTNTGFSLKKLGFNGNFKGFINEVVLCDSVLSTSDRNKVTAYLGARQNIVTS